MVPQNETLRDSPYATREYYPCILYKTSTNDETFYTVESMHGGPYSGETASDTLECKLSFNCDNDQKVFYKLKKDCSRVEFRDFRIQPVHTTDSFMSRFHVLK